MKCTCKVSDVKTYGDAIQIMIDYCPKHAMVDEVIEINKDLLAALKEMVYTFDCGVGNYSDEAEAITVANAALAKAEPKERGE